MAWLVKDRLQPYRPTRTEPYLTDAMKKIIADKYFPRYPTKQAALLPLFHLVMHEYGFIASDAIAEAATFLEISESQVQDAVTFYEEFRMQPTGKHVVNVCRSISCEVCGHENILKKIKDVFGIDPGETTDDNLFTVFEVECLGLCELAPAALINEEIHGPLTPDGFCATLKQLPKESKPHGNGQH
jgi:NADH:ubiquinone oxidoreductase subunit E